MMTPSKHSRVRPEFGRFVSRFVCLLLLVCPAAATAELPPIPPALQEILPAEHDVLARVNGQPVTGKEVRVRMLTATQQEQQRPLALKDYVQQSIDRSLIEQFLKRRKIEVADSLIKDRMQIFQQRAGDAAALERMGLDEELLRRQVTLSLAWLQHTQATLTDAQYREYFKSHRSELDGTRLRLQQVFRPLSADAIVDQRTEVANELTQLRARINSGEVSFEEVAGTDGDLGWQTAQGNAPTEVLRAAFQLPDGAVSGVVSTAEGLYLVRVVERIPGQLSLEDVRTDVLSALSTQLWDEEVARQRQSVRVDWSLP